MCGKFVGKRKARGNRNFFWLFFKTESSPIWQSRHCGYIVPTRRLDIRHTGQFKPKLQSLGRIKRAAGLMVQIQHGFDNG